MWDLTRSNFEPYCFLPFNNQVGMVFRQNDAGGKRNFQYFADFGRIFEEERGYRSLSETNLFIFDANFSGASGSETLRK